MVFNGSRADRWNGSSFFFHVFVTQLPLLVRTCLMMASCRGAIVRCFSFRVREERLCPSGGCGTWASSYRCCRGRRGSFRRGIGLNTLLVSLPASSRSSFWCVVISSFCHRGSTEKREEVRACAHATGHRRSNQNSFWAAVLSTPCEIPVVARTLPKPCLPSHEPQPINSPR